MQRRDARADGQTGPPDLHASPHAAPAAPASEPRGEALKKAAPGAPDGGQEPSLQRGEREGPRRRREEEEEGAEPLWAPRSWAASDPTLRRERWK